mmetsp:Transcript_742/g.4676  ORF Transcript_742/g.4676 Transcript_742/m.4676 type:complete len:273 (+) Transcript_742:146-964(+)
MQERAGERDGGGATCVSVRRMATAQGTGRTVACHRELGLGVAHACCSGIQEDDHAQKEEFACAAARALPRRARSGRRARPRPRTRCRKGSARRRFGRGAFRLLVPRIGRRIQSRSKALGRQSDHLGTVRVHRGRQPRRRAGTRQLLQLGEERWSETATCAVLGHARYARGWEAIRAGAARTWIWRKRIPGDPCRCDVRIAGGAAGRALMHRTAKQHHVSELAAKRPTVRRCERNRTRTDDSVLCSVVLCSFNGRLSRTSACPCMARARDGIT